MSGIFDMFGGTGNAVKQQPLLVPTDTPKKSAINTTMFGGGATAKNVGLTSRSKPKGLSIRPGNDPNISNLSIENNTSAAKKSPVKDLSKAGFFQQQASPNKAKTLKVQTMRSKQLKASKVKSPEGGLVFRSKQAEEYIFKKPITPKKRTEKIQIYREPEKLANYYDFNDDLEDCTTLDTEFVKLVKLDISIKHDEGFESDPETIRQPTPPRSNASTALLDDWIEPATPLDLPELSDDEDFWN